jgi:hypothetical protein
MDYENFLALALQELRPNSYFAFFNNDYNQLEWFEGNELDPPTLEELTEKAKELFQRWKDTEYQRQRAPEYPPITDQLDAIWKGGNDYEEMLAKVMEVKAKYPKTN